MTARRVGERKRIAVEQRFALGDLPEEIAARLDVRLTDVLRVGEAMDAAAHEHKQPLHAQPPPGRRSHCKHGHPMTDDNVVGKYRECRTCKRERERERNRTKKAAA